MFKTLLMLTVELNIFRLKWNNKLCVEHCILFDSICVSKMLISEENPH